MSGAEIQGVGGGGEVRSKDQRDHRGRSRAETSEGSPEPQKHSEGPQDWT